VYNSGYCVNKSKDKVSPYIAVVPEICGIRAEKRCLLQTQKALRSNKLNLDI
jgi:hypothetical protein